MNNQADTEIFLKQQISKLVSKIDYDLLMPD